MRLVADQPLERGLLADRVQVGVVLRGTAKLLRHLDGVPEVIERVTRPAAETLAAVEVVEQHGVLRSGCDQGGEAVGDLDVLARLIEGARCGRARWLGASSEPVKKSDLCWSLGWQGAARSLAIRAVGKHVVQVGLDQSQQSIDNQRVKGLVELRPTE